ncbi:MAG: hypothetical protein M0Q92_13915 [Methanoregula sp.]|jgi:hypothetical protein|nr:hypothetical protein [Methanoregula sp.]
MKLGVVLLALLLTGMAMVPIVSAASISETSDVMADSLANETMTINGETLPEILWVTHQIDASKAKKPYSEEEFRAVNKEYIDYLVKTVGKEAAEKIVNDQLTQKTTAKIGVLGAPDPTNIRHILNKDVYVWAYETASAPYHDLNDPDASPIGFVVLKQTNDEFATYLQTLGFSRGIDAFIQFGYRGSSLNNLDWNYGAINMMKPSGVYRYHCTVHEGGWSSVLQDYWSYGECHKETQDGHYLIPNAYTIGEDYLYSNIGSGYNKYTSNFDNAGTYFDGTGHVYLQK